MPFVKLRKKYISIKFIVIILILAVIFSPLVVYLQMQNIMREEISKRESTISELQSKLEELAKERDELKSVVSELQAQIKALKQTISDRESELQSIKQTLANATKMMEKKEEEIRELEERMQTLQRELEQALGGLPESSRIISLYPWILMTSERREDLMTVTLTIENNVDHSISVMNISYLAIARSGVIAFEEATYDAEFFRLLLADVDRGFQAFFSIMDGASLGIGDSKLIKITISLTPNTTLYDEIIVEPQPHSDLDKNYNQVNDILEEEIRIKKRTGEAVSIIVSLRGNLTKDDLNLFRSYDGLVLSNFTDGFCGNISASNFWVYFSAASRRIRFIDPNAPISPSLDRSTRNIRATSVWSAHPPFRFRGESMASVAILDTGIDDSHPGVGPFRDVSAAGWGGLGPNDKLIGWRDFTSHPLAAPSDHNGHGTHVAGIAAGDGDGNPANVYVGVAPDTRIVGVRVLPGTSMTVIRGINWVRDNKERYRIVVAGMSLGGPPNARERQAVDELACHNVLPVVAAGNEFELGLTVGSPGDADRAITVGAVDDNDRVAEFSSNGGLLLNKPDVVAPGVGVNSADSNDADRNPGPDNYVELSGTSMATPHVVGLAALLVDALTDYDHVDEDGDGAVDEDPWDGVDNDGDGLIDEDLAPWDYQMKIGDSPNDYEVFRDVNQNCRYDKGVDVVLYEGEIKGIQSVNLIPLSMKLKSIILMTAFEVQNGLRADARWRHIDRPPAGVGWNDYFFYDSNNNGRLDLSQVRLVNIDADPVFERVELVGENPVDWTFNRIAFRSRAVAWAQADVNGNGAVGEDFDGDGNPDEWEITYDLFYDFDGDGVRDGNEPAIRTRLLEITAGPGRGIWRKVGADVVLNAPAYPQTPTAGRFNRPPLNRGRSDRIEGYGMVSADAALDAVTKTFCGEATGTLGRDPDDKKVWAAKVYLYKNAWYTLYLHVPEGADFDLYLYYSNPILDSGRPYMERSSTKAGAGVDEKISYLQPLRDGIYYVVVKWVSGEGEFKLEMETEKKYTVMVYMAADEEGLDDLAFQDLNEIERAGQNKDVSLVVQVDWHERNDGKAYTNLTTWLQDNRPNRRWRSHLISLHNLWSGASSSCIIKDEVNTGDPEELVKFVNFSVRHFPANHYILVLWGDGDGWKVNEKFSDGKSSGLLADSRNGTVNPQPDSLKISELRNALKKMTELEEGIAEAKDVTTILGKLDVLWLDAPLMATIEVAYEIKDYVRYMVASQGAWAKPGYEPPTKRMDDESGGWNYTKVIRQLMSWIQQKPDFSPREFAEKLPRLGDGDVHSASSIDLKKINELKSAVDSLAKQLKEGTRYYKEHLDPKDNVAERLRQIRLKVETFGGAINLTRLIYAYDLDPGTEGFFKPRRYKRDDPVWGDMDYIDLKHFAVLVRDDEGIPDKYKSAAPEVIKLVEEAVLSEYHNNATYTNAYGLSIYFPYQQDRVDSLREYDFSTPSPLSADDYSSAVRFPNEAKNWPGFLHAYYTPVADIGFDTLMTFAGIPIPFNGKGSSDTDSSREFVSKGYVSQYSWNFGDGESYSERWNDVNNNGRIDSGEAEADDGQYDGMTTHQYTKTGVFTPTLTCRDEDGKESIDKACVLILPLPWLIPFPPYTEFSGEISPTNASYRLMYMLDFELGLGYGKFVDGELRGELRGMAAEAMSSISQGDYPSALETVNTMYGLVLEGMVESEEKANVLQTLSDVMMLLEILETPVHLRISGTYEEPYMEAGEVVFPLTISYELTLPGEVEYASSITSVISATCPAPQRADP